MSKPLRLLLVALSMMLIGGGDASAEPSAAKLLGPRGQDALKARDAAAFRALLEGKIDVWNLCHELCLFGAPDVALQAGSVTLAAPHGASIGYRVADGPWRLYTGPLPRVSVAGRDLTAKAVRYGWQPSDEVTVTP